MTRMEGPEALAATVPQLEGFEAPAGAWESEILPARVADYEPAWLDDECLAGRVAWMRLRPREERANGAERGATPVRTTPITLLAAPPCAALAGAVADGEAPHAEQPRRRRSPTSSGSTARHFSMNWSPAPGCCARRSRRRSPNWWRLAS